MQGRGRTCGRHQRVLLRHRDRQLKDAALVGRVLGALHKGAASRQLSSVLAARRKPPSSVWATGAPCCARAHTLISARHRNTLLSSGIRSMPVASLLRLASLSSCRTAGVCVARRRPPVLMHRPLSSHVAEVQRVP